MRKIFTILLLSFVTAGFGQSIVLTYNSQNLNNEDTLKLEVLNLNDDNFYHFGYINRSSDTIKLQVKQTVQFLNDASISYCFNGECLDGDLSVEMTLYPEDTISDGGTDMRELKLQYLPRSAGTSLVKYTFLNRNEGSEHDSVAIYVLFSTPTSTKTYVSKVSMLNAYPNPASSQVTVQYKISDNQAADLRLVVKNLMGAIIYTMPLSAKEDKVTLDVSNLVPGLYFYSIEAGKSVLLTKKLSVR